MEGIRLVMSRMQHALIKHGFITTHIYLQPQDLMMGTLIVNIIPGRIHALTHHTTSNRRISLWITITGCEASPA